MKNQVNQINQIKQIKNQSMNLTTAYLLLFCAIIAEVTGSTFLAKSDGFSKFLPSVMTLMCFGVAFYLLSQVLKTIPLGVAYAIWSGAGIVLTAIIGFVALKQSLDMPAIIGIGLIVMGVLVMNVFSKSVGH